MLVRPLLRRSCSSPPLGHFWPLGLINPTSFPSPRAWQHKRWVSKNQEHVELHQSGRMHLGRVSLRSLLPCQQLHKRAVQARQRSMRCDIGLAEPTGSRHSKHGSRSNALVQNSPCWKPEAASNASRRAPCSVLSPGHQSSEEARRPARNARSFL